MQQLEPKPENLENTDNRSIWCNRVQSIRPIIQVMKTLIFKPLQQQVENTNSDTRFPDQLFGDRSAHILQNCRFVPTVYLNKERGYRQLFADGETYCLFQDGVDSFGCCSDVY